MFLATRLTEREQDWTQILVTTNRIVKSETFPEFININGTSDKFYTQIKEINGYTLTQ